MKTRQFLTAAVATTAFAFAGVASGQYVWTGSVDSTWTDPDNWNQPNYPGEVADGAVVVIPGSPQDQPELSATLPNPIASLVVQQDAYLQILTANGSLEVSGNVDIDSPSALNTNPHGIRLNHAASLLEIQGTLTVQATTSRGNRIPAVLHAQAGTVNLVNDGSHPIGGNILLGDNGRLLISGTSNQTTLVPYLDGATARYGQVIGADVTSTVEIATAAILVNNIVMHGGMTVTGTEGTFVNGRNDTEGQGWDQPVSGIVQANSGLTIELAEGLTILDSDFLAGGLTYRPSWEARGSGSVLRFSEPAGSCATMGPLLGTFVIDENAILCLSIDESESVETSGNFEEPDGTGTAVFASPAFGEASPPFFAYECTFVEQPTVDCP